MDIPVLVFWASVLLVGYVYVAYPLAVWFLAYLWPKPIRRRGPLPRSVSFIVAARNEGPRIAQRIEELKRQLDAAGVQGEVILVLDAPDCPDGQFAALAADPRVQVVRLPEHRGKAAAISEGARRAKYEILALADVRQRWHEDALERLLENFRDPRIGAVSGDLVLESPTGVVQGVGLYWKYEKWLRRSEARFDSVVLVTGAICAVRRELFEGVPAAAVADDLYWPLRVIMRGYRVVHDCRARAFDRLPAGARDEFRRKLRTLAGNYQLITLLPSGLLPWKNRVWWQFVSHKLLRLAVPWALLAAALASALADGVLYQSLCLGQAAGYGLLLGVVATGTAGRWRLSSAAASFALLNLAAWLAFWVWLSGNAGRSWGAVGYADAVGSCQTGPFGSRRTRSGAETVAQVLDAVRK